MMNLFAVLVSMALAFVLGKLLTKIKMPAILGWLIAGMIVGPYALNLLSNDVMNNEYVKVAQSIMECMLGLMLGTELVIKKIKESGKAIVVTTLFQSIGTFLFVSLVFAVVFWFMDVPIFLSVFFGAIALATAPAPALSIVKEFNTKGPVTDTLIPMAVLDDIVAIIIFFSITSIFGGTGSFLETVIMMILVPILIGLAVGILVGKVMNKYDDKSILTGFLLGTILLLSGIGLFVNNVILGEPLINFLLLGMAFAAGFSNMVDEEKLEKIMTIASPLIGVSIIFVILNLGAPLNYQLILGAGTLTAVYIVSRMIGKYFGAYAGASVMKMPETVKKYLGLTLLPHSGVSLVFTGMAAATLMPIDPALAQIIQGTIAAAAIINEVIAVILAQKAFKWAGEIQGE